MGKPRRTDWQAPFLASFALHGIQHHACTNARVDPGTVKIERNRDEGFSRAYDDAYEASIAALELNAFTWARGGLVLTKTRTVTRTDAKGNVTSTVTSEEHLERSPAMTIFMLKARRPDVYRERLHVQSDVTIETVNTEEADAASGAFDAAVVRLADRRRAQTGDQRSDTG